ETAARVYDEIAEKLATPEFLPRALFQRFNIEVLATTDSASDSLDHHRTIRESGWKGRVIPCFRPDAVLRIAPPEWPPQPQALARCATTAGWYSSASVPTGGRTSRSPRSSPATCARC